MTRQNRNSQDRSRGTPIQTVVAKNMQSLSTAQVQATVGKSLEFYYPKINYPYARPGLVRRRILVTRIRDLVIEPLDPLTLQLDPHVRRGRYLVIGQDYDRGGEERQFYASQMIGVAASPPRYSVILVDDCNHERERNNIAASAEPVFSCHTREEAIEFCRAWQIAATNAPGRLLILDSKPDSNASAA
jgi:hypothetical protein